MSRTYLRGDMYYADLGRGIGSEQEGYRPVVIIQNNNSSTPPVVSDDKEKRTYSIEEIQQILDISRSTAYLLIKRKLFKSVKVGKQIRISKKSFDEWLDTF